ncbi:MAG: hypothetical protein E7208_07105 [Clostridium butyricum]|nr:hypothetical protein [Clostridium butyricum]
MISNSLKKLDDINVQKDYSKKYKQNQGKTSNIKRNVITKKELYTYICIISITITSFIVSYYTYINTNSKDLSYAVEYNLTRGLPSDKKLFRVQSMSLIESKNTTAIVKASGLSKSTPHKTISVIANFEKENEVWILKHIY